MVDYELGGDGIALITINRPEQLNALDRGVMDGLEQHFREAHSDDAVRGIIITGAGEKSFVAGADIRQFRELDALEGHRFALRGQAIFNQIEDMPKPVVAAVNGYALGGGCELALACHLRIASENAQFGQPEVDLGILPGYGGTQRLPRIVGRGLAMEMILTGERVSAQRALEIGLVNRVVPRGVLLDVARELLLKVAEKAPIAIRLALDALRVSDQPLRQGLRYEAALFGQACASEDFREGTAAFLERRKASFQGR